MAAAIVAGLGGAAVATAQKVVTFTGSTGDDVAVKLTVASFGNATAFRVGANDVKCNKGTLSNQAFIYKPLDVSDPGAFSDKSRSSSKLGKFTFKSESKLTGTATPDGTAWSGTYKLTTRVLKKGTRIDTCKVNTTWDAV